MKRRIIGLILAICLILPTLSQFPVENVFADTVGDFEYTINDNNEVEITGYNGAGTEVVIPSEIEGCPVTSIGDYAFGWCSSLSSITIPKSVTSIGDWTFCDCSSLSSITIPESVTSIGNGAFSGCDNLASIIVDENNTVYDSRDNCNAIIESYTNSLIAGCKDTVIPDSVTNIGESAFKGCYGLTDIEIPASVTTINEFAFDGCINLLHIKFSNGLKYIERAAFRDSGLTKIEFPESLETIEWESFSGCSSLENVTFPDSLYYIREVAFAGCVSLKHIRVPSGVKAINPEAFYGSNLNEIEVDENNEFYSSQNGVLFNKEKTELVLYPRNRSGTYIVPEGVEQIGSYAFAGCIKLIGISLPESLTYIGERAFKGCTNIVRMIIPQNVEYIGNWLFEYCENLTDLYFVGNPPSSSYGIISKMHLMPINVYYPEDNELWSQEEKDSLKASDNKIIIWNSWSPQQETQNITLFPVEGDYDGKGYPKISHPCPANKNIFWEYTSPYNTENIELRFSDFSHIEGSSKIIIVDAYGHTYTLTKGMSCGISVGTNGAGGSHGEINNIADISIFIDGSWFGMQLVTDESDDAYGFSFADSDDYWDYIISESKEIAIDTEYQVEGQIPTTYIFKPETSGKYIIYSYDDTAGDPIAYLYDSDMNEIISNDDHDGNNFKIEYDLTGGETYYIKVRDRGFGKYHYNMIIKNLAPVIYDMNETNILQIDSIEIEYYYRIVPEKTAEYVVESMGSEDTYISLYLADDLENAIATDDDSGEGLNFKLTYALEAGKEYYYEPFFTEVGTGTIEFTFKQAQQDEQQGEIVTVILDANGGEFGDYRGESFDRGIAVVKGERSVIDAALKDHYQHSGFIDFSEGLEISFVPEVDKVGNKRYIEYISNGNKAFAGWSLDSDGNRMVENVENDETTLYAVWKDTFKITYDLNGLKLYDKTEHSRTEEILKLVEGMPLSESYNGQVPTGAWEGSDIWDYQNKPIHYDIVGWSADKEGKNPVDLEKFVPQADMTLYAIWNQTISVEAISLNKNQIEIEAGGSETLNAAIEPEDATNKAVAWSSSDTSIASVDVNGKVTAKKKGTAVITVTSEDNGKTATCTVIVKEKETVKPVEPVQPSEEPIKPVETPAQPSGQSAPERTQTDSGAQFSDVTEKTVVPTSLKAINWAVDNGIVKGYSDNTFKPETICTREQFTIMLWRFAGEPASNASAVNKFTDVSDFSNNTSKKAVAWAVEQGVIKGFSDGSFQPKEDITRAQVAVMLWRFAGEKSVSANSRFSDISSYSSSVQNAIIWEESAGVASGYKDGTFKPDDGCQRQHMAIFLYRFNSKVDQYKSQD